MGTHDPTVALILALLCVVVAYIVWDNVFREGR